MAKIYHYYQAALMLSQHEKNIYSKTYLDHVNTNISGQDQNKIAENPVFLLSPDKIATVSSQIISDILSNKYIRPEKPMMNDTLYEHLLSKKLPALIDHIFSMPSVPEINHKTNIFGELSGYALLPDDKLAVHELLLDCEPSEFTCIDDLVYSPIPEGSHFIMAAKSILCAFSEDIIYEDTFYISIDELIAEMQAKFQTLELPDDMGSKEWIRDHLVILEYSKKV